MRIVRAGLILTFVLTFAPHAFGQSGFTVAKPAASRTSRPAATSGETTVRHQRVTPQEEEIHQRAAQAARMRDARIQSRRYFGYSPSRPTMNVDQPLPDWYYTGWLTYQPTYYPRVR